MTMLHQIVADQRDERLEDLPRTLGLAPPSNESILGVAPPDPRIRKLRSGQGNGSVR